MEGYRERGFRDVRRLAFIVVNAQTRPTGRWSGLAQRTPGVIDFLDAVTSVQVSRYNFETVDLLRRSIKDWREEYGATPAAPVDFYLVEVTFDALDSEAEAQALHAIPTALQLDDDQVDRLRAAATRLLRGSPEYQRLLHDLGAPIADPVCPRAAEATATQ